MSFLIDFSIFKRNRHFTLLYIGQVVSFLGTSITGVALPYQIYMSTHSTMMVGLLSLAQLVPLLFTALIGGVFADRYHRRFLLLGAELILAVGSLALAINAALPKPHIWELFVVSAIMSAFNGLHRPALDSMLQQIVPKQDFAQVSVLASFKFSVVTICGPAIAGLLLARTGMMVTYFIDFMTFVVSLTALLLMQGIPKPHGPRSGSVWGSLKEGLHYAMSRQELMGTYFVDFAAMVFGMPSALFPAIALSYGGPEIVGILYSAPAFGALFVSFMSGWTSKIDRQGMAVGLSAAGWGVAIIFFGLAHQLWLAVCCLALAGAFDALSGVFRMTLWNQTIPNHLRGRLAGIEMISYLSGPKLGDTEAGLVAGLFGITASVVSGGVLCMAGVALCCYYLPKFWHYRASNS